MVDDDALPPVVQAALVHAQFETVHPFDGGNGRTGRTLVHVVLRRRRSDAAVWANARVAPDRSCGMNFSRVSKSADDVDPPDGADPVDVPGATAAWTIRDGDEVVLETITGDGDWRTRWTVQVVCDDTDLATAVLSTAAVAG